MLFLLCHQLYGGGYLCIHLKDIKNISNKLQKMGAIYFNGVKIRTAMRSAVITGPGGEIGRHKRLKISRS
jgi:hypothetical protein